MNFDFSHSSWVVASAVVVFVSLAFYADPTGLYGELTYDDKGTVLWNPVVTTEAPWSDVWKKDFWGKDDLDSPNSHKSWRPITTGSYKLNYYFSGYSTLTYHLVNVALHACASLATLFVARAMMLHAPRAQQYAVSLVAALIFATHPVHAESVSNITGRAEVLSGLFYALGFLLYVRAWTPAAADGDVSLHSVRSWLLTLGTLLCTLCSLLSKEHGITMPIVCVAWDFVILSQLSLAQFFGYGAADAPPRARLPWLARTLALAIGTLAIAAWRISLNGDSKPNLWHDQNPAAFAPERLTRALSFSWIHLLNMWLLVWPTWCCPDWSAKSIALVRSFDDYRAWIVLAWWALLVACVVRLVAARRGYGTGERQIVIGAMWGIISFFMSSNLLFMVGFVIADRVLYIPLFAWGFLFGWLLWRVCGGEQRRFVALLAVVLACYYPLTFERNYAWSSHTRLWESAYRVNKLSHQVRHELSLGLINDGRGAEAEYVLRSAISDDHRRDPSLRYLLAAVLRSLGDCDSANDLLLDALSALSGGAEHRGPGFNHREETFLAYLYVELSRCSPKLAEMGQFALEAVKQAKTGEQQKYAMDHAQAIDKVVHQVIQMGIDVYQVYTWWNMEGDVQFGLNGIPPDRFNNISKEQRELRERLMRERVTMRALLAAKKKKWDEEANQQQQ
jgi:hypothetical protein